MGFIDKLNWRYATKKYNGALVSQENLDTILEAIRMAPSSSGTQPYHIVVTSGQMKNALIENSGQTAKIGASHLLVFCTRIDYPARAGKQIAVTAETQKVSVESLEGLSKVVNGSWKKWIDLGQVREWAARQTYIALGFGLAAAAELSIDASPMEGFKPEEFKQILQLPEYMDPVVIMALGYRDPADPAQPAHRAKMRFPKDDLFDFRT